jgi:hypothetical protein
VCHTSTEDHNAEVTPPTPPPRRTHLSRVGGSFRLGCIGRQQSEGGEPFSRIAGGLKLAQTQAMAVAGFQPDEMQEDEDVESRRRASEADTEVRLSLSSRVTSPLTYRASFHGRGIILPHSQTFTFFCTLRSPNV